MPKEIAVKNKGKRITVQVPQIVSITSAIKALSERRVLVLLNMALEQCYRTETRKRLKRGEDNIAESMKTWVPPGELPPEPSQELLEKYRSLPPEQQTLFKRQITG